MKWGLNLIGMKFGLLSPVERVDDVVSSLGNHKIMYRCLCDCGSEKVVASCNLLNGNTKSCGCVRKATAQIKKEEITEWLKQRENEKKVCRKCGVEKIIDQYRVYKKRGQETYTTYSTCIDCIKEWHKEYNVRNKDMLLKKRQEKKEQYAEARKKVYWREHDKRKEALKKRYREDIIGRLLSSAKRRAMLEHIPFDICREDIVVSEYCPALGLKLEVGTGVSQDQSPSLDRIIPKNGYVKGNIIVVSHKANTIKNNSTIDELEKVYVFYKNLTGGD